MSDEKTQKMLERVRALLAKSEDRSVTPEEAQTFREKADELMTRYAIDQWQVAAAQSGVGKRPDPERRDMERSWSGSRFYSDLVGMFDALADHCRCVVGWRGQHGGTVPVYGLPSDLDYLDVLFTTLLLEVHKNMDPPVDPHGDLGHEVFKQRQSGIAWPRITRKVYDAELVTLSKAERKKLDEQYARYSLDPFPADHRPTWEELSRYDWSHNSDLGDVRTSMKNRLANANRSYIKKEGRQQERNYVKPDVYQRSFMYGFTREIRDRIWRMSEASRRSYDESTSSGSFAVAVRDIREQALDLYKQEYPPPPPVPVDPNYKPPKGRAVKVREVTIDHGSIRAGRAAGAKVNLSQNPNRGVGQRGQLPK